MSAALAISSSEGSLHQVSVGSSGSLSSLVEAASSPAPSGLASFDRPWINLAIQCVQEVRLQPMGIEVMDRLVPLGSHVGRTQARYPFHHKGRTGFSSAAPAALQPFRWPHGVLKCCARHAKKVCNIIVQTKSLTKPTALWREHYFGVAGQTV